MSRRDRDGFLRGHAQALATAEANAHGWTSHMSQESGAPSQSTVSNRPYVELKLINEREMEIGKVHTGRALVCKTLSCGLVYTALTVIVEDPAGDALRLGLYNFTTLRARQDLDRLLPIGSLMLIIDPFYKIAGDGEPAVRSDKAEDVVILKSWDVVLKNTPWYVPKPAPPTPADEWRLKGNAHFMKGKFRDAIGCYTKGVESNPQDAVLLSNRSQAYISIGRPSEALIDADKAIALDPKNVKAHQRRGRALFDLERYREALRSFVTASYTAGDTLNETAEEWRRKSITAARESEKGVYDWSGMAAKLAKDSHTNFDCATYMNPNISIVDGPEGKRFIAKCALEPGTLVIVEKAIAVMWMDDKPEPVFDLGGFTMASPEDIALSYKVWALVQQNDALCAKVMSLSRGMYSKMLGDLRVEATPTLNVIKEIAFTNKFSTFSPFLTMRKKEGTPENPNPPIDAGEGTGLWDLCSRFNHKCLPNCSWGTLGNVMIVRAVRRVEAGEECFLTYVTIEEDLETRTRKLSPRNITCTCELCVYQRNLPAGRMQLIEKEVARWRRRCSERHSSCDEGLPALCARVDAWIPELNFLSVLACLMTANYFMHTGNDNRALEYFTKVYEKLKADPRLLATSPHVATETSIQCAARCYCMFNKAGVRKWGKKARDGFALVFGPSPALFELAYRDRLSEDFPNIFEYMTGADGTL